MPGILDSSNTRGAAGRLSRLLTYALLAGVPVVTLYPLVWMLFGSLKSDAEFYTNIWGPPTVPIWQNYRDAWATGGIGRSFVNSLVVTGSTVAIVLACTSLAAYAFATISFPGRNFLFYLLLISMMVPQAVLIIPTFTVISQFGLVNTRLSLVLVYAAGQMGFGTFILRAYFLSLPRDLSAAALIDGCTHFGAFWRVMLPLARPGLAAVLIFTSMAA